MNNHYNNLMSTDIARLGIQKSFDQSQEIKPNELLINDDMLNINNKRHGFDQTNKIINMQPIHPDGIVLYLKGGRHYLWLKSNEGSGNVQGGSINVTIEEEYNE